MIAKTKKAKNGTKSIRVRITIWTRKPNYSKILTKNMHLMKARSKIGELELVHKESVFFLLTEYLEEPECQIDPKLCEIYEVPPHEIVQALVTKLDKFNKEKHAHRTKTQMRQLRV